jgi:hypothetical protein
MSKIIRQGPPPPDPLEELRDEISSLRSDVAVLETTISENHRWVKDTLQEILREMEMKSDRDD